MAEQGEGGRRTVLVTGAARGIGEACSRRLAERGDQVVLVGLEADRLAGVATACGSDTALAVEADVRDPVALKAAVARGVARFGGIDAVVANAGIGVTGPIATTDAALVQAMVDVNVMGTLHTIQATLPALRESQGYLLVVSSLAAASRTAGFGGYSATKAATEALAATLRLEVAADGVGVGIAYFGFLDTDLVRDASTNAGFEALRATAPGPLRRPAPVDGAVDGIVRALDRRAEKITYPRGVATVLALRTALWRVDRRSATRHAPAIVDAFAQEVADDPETAYGSARTVELARRRS